MKASLQIQVAEKGPLSYLKKSYFTTPFKVMNITEDRHSHPLHLMLMSSSPGILDGDIYNMEIEVEEGAHLQLHTQAYQRLFHMKTGASQQLKVTVATGASFVYIPHPSVPHEQSSFVSHNNFYLQQHRLFIFGEVLTCGRKLNGEAFLFSKYHGITQVFINNKLVIKENLLMQPALIDVQAIGQLEGYTHQASMIYLEENADVTAVQQKLLRLLEKEKNIAFGVTKAPVNGLIIRLLGNGAEQLYTLLKNFSVVLTAAEKQP